VTYKVSSGMLNLCSLTPIWTVLRFSICRHFFESGSVLPEIFYLAISTCLYVVAFHWYLVNLVQWKVARQYDSICKDNFCAGYILHICITCCLFWHRFCLIPVVNSVLKLFQTAVMKFGSLCECICPMRLNK